MRSRLGGGLRPAARTAIVRDWPLLHVGGQPLLIVPCMYKAPYRRTRPAEARSSPDSGRIVILGGLLRKLLAIHAHYEDRGERLVAIIAQREDGERFEASVTDAGRLFHVKLRVAAQGVHEYGREEDL